MAAEGEYPEVIYGCWCGYTFTTPGKCRSHPMPARAMGPTMRPYKLVTPVTLADAVRAARGGPAPTPLRAFA